MDEFVAMQDHCRQLEDEVLKLKTEGDTIKYIFPEFFFLNHFSFDRELFRITTVNVDPNMININPILLPNNTESQPTPQSHPLICFWTCAKFLEWQEDAEGHADNCGSFPFLEQENGGPVDEAVLVEICYTMQSIWAELRNCSLAPPSWGKVGHSACKLFHQLVENTHPLFRFAKDGWKLERLATTGYSGWTRTYLQDNDLHQIGWMQDHVHFLCVARHLTRYLIFHLIPMVRMLSKLKDT